MHAHSAPSFYASPQEALEGPPEESEAVRALAVREMVAPWGDREPPLGVDAGMGRTWLEAK